ncbi:MAG: hypothetical protein HOY44_21765 [Maritimibacter sp.]|jgi:hypothetical protein|nr:hypothetical protein [Maritimibacter sp.]MBL6430149.1 hypothetical protein [Maritimibacter sp.]
MRSVQSKQNVMIGTTLLFTAGCAIPPSSGSDAANVIGDIPDSVVAMAAPDQDISTARLVPDDGCYWYEHSGPVETTLIPLRTPNGSRICTARES